MKSLGKIAFTGLLAIAVAGLLSTSLADDETSAAGAAFSGKASEVDKSAQTLKVGSRTFQALPTTQILRNGKSATFQDIKSGEQLAGRYKKSADDKLELLSLNLSGKASEATGGTKEGPETSEAGAAFSGKVVKINKSAQTLTVGRRTFQILPTTQILKADGGSASSDDLKAGEQVSGKYKKSAEGRLELLSLDIGKKAERK